MNRSLNQIGCLADIVQHDDAEADDQAGEEATECVSPAEREREPGAAADDRAKKRYGGQHRIERCDHARLESEQYDEVGCPGGASAGDDADQPPQPHHRPCRSHRVRGQREGSVGPYGADDSGDQHQTLIVVVPHAQGD